MPVRKALLFGLNYLTDSAASLSGCINDAKNLRELLVNELGFDASDVLVCTDETPLKPTKSVMLALIREMCLWTHRVKVDQLFISYSGHGTQVPDANGDEKDASPDSAFCPLDFRTNGFITDDDIGAMIRQVHPRTDVIMLVDACHSGSICDLPFQYRFGDHYAVENDASVPARIIMISGCKDSQTSQETFDSKSVVGMMTSSFIHALRSHNFDVTCFRLIKYMNDYITQCGFAQRPQLNTSRRLTETCIFVSNSMDSAKPFFLRPLK